MLLKTAVQMDSCIYTPRFSSA